MIDKTTVELPCKSVCSFDKSSDVLKNTNNYQRTFGISTLSTCLHEKNDNDMKGLQNCLFGSLCGIVTLVLGVVAGIAALVSWMTPSSQK